MRSSYELFLRKLGDPRWIPHISDYCDSRCNRCAFNERCWSFALQEHERRVADGQVLPEDQEGECVPEEVKVPGWAERHGIDFDDTDPDSAEERRDQQRQARIDSDPLVRCAHEYGEDVFRVLRPFHAADDSPAARQHSAEVAEAFHDVCGLSLRISVKVHRAVSSLEFNKDEETETDLIQNDSNGSAKVVLLAIADTITAWQIIQSAALVDPGLITYFTDTCKKIACELCDRFPLAMAFVRPGFDEEVPGLVRPWTVDPTEGEDEEADED
jgi:hypothetical protein